MNPTNPNKFVWEQGDLRFCKIMTSYQVNVAGESYACTLMSMAGYDVSIQYGTTQPDWDIQASRKERDLKISVKGSQDGGWGLFQNHLKNADYHAALDSWLLVQPEKIVYLLVQFKDVMIGESPRAYIARPSEIFEHMKTTRAGHAYTSLRENYHYQKGIGAGYKDVIPESWKATQSRIDTI